MSVFSGVESMRLGPRRSYGGCARSRRWCWVCCWSPAKDPIAASDHPLA